MPTYLITNRAPASFHPGPEAFAAWTAWFEHLGSHLEDRGNPASKCTALGNCGPDTSLGGYTLIRADNLEAAVALAQAHPLMTRGGGVEIGELTLINEGRQLIAEAE
jgi:hypothetical protein